MKPSTGATANKVAKLGMVSVGSRASRARSHRKLYTCLITVPHTGNLDNIECQLKLKNKFNDEKERVGSCTTPAPQSLRGIPLAKSNLEPHGEVRPGR